MIKINNIKLTPIGKCSTCTNTQCVKKKHFKTLHLFFSHMLARIVPTTHTRTYTIITLILNQHQDDYIDDDEFDYVPDLPHLISANNRRLKSPPPPPIQVDTSQPSPSTTISDVPVSPFSINRRPAQGLASFSPPQSPGDVIALINDDPERRKFMNPVSYLGGPLLEPRNRKSLDSMLSVD